MTDSTNPATDKEIRVLVVKGEHNGRRGAVEHLYSPKANHPLVKVNVYHENGHRIGQIVGRMGKDFLLLGENA